MYVLHLASWYSIKADVASGRFLLDYCQALKSVHVESDILFLDMKPSFLFKKSNTITYNGIHVSIINAFAPPKRTTWGIRVWLKKSCDAFKKEYRDKKLPDIIHAHSYLGALQAHRIHEELGIPFVYTEHLSAFLLSGVSKRYENFLIKMNKDAAFRSAVSPDLCRVLESKYHQLFVQIGNPVDTDFFVLATPQKAVKEIIVFAFGDPPQVKGLDRMIDLASQLVDRGFKFHLFIGDKVRQLPSWEKRIAKYNLQQYITFTGYLDREGLRSCLHRADVFLSLSRVETFSIAIVEALSTGLPVISTAVAGPQGYWEEAMGVLFEYESPESALKAFKQFQSHRKHFNHQEIRKKAVDNFSYETIAGKWSDIYNTTLNS